jgi:hypothetical protein
MKNKSVIQLFFMSFVLISTASCQKEEFYEKEYIESFKEQYEKEQAKIVEVLDEQGPSDDGSTTGDDGSTTGDDGSTTGDDGSTTGDDGSTTGDDGSTTGDDGSQTTSVEDSFTQTATALKKLDVLWVVDNSGSMREEQENLGKNFKDFINKFSNLGIDFKMSITTTDTRGNNAGKPVQNSLEKLTSEELSKDRQGFLDNFNNMVQVGINGWGREKGLKASESFSNRFANLHFRDDAYFVIIYVSDEEDQSEKTVDNHFKQIAKWKSNPGLVKAYSIVDTSSPLYDNQYLVSGYKRYKDMSDLTGGYVADINDNFSSTLLKMGNNIAELTKSFPLSQIPFDASLIKVFVNGIEDNRWIYDPANRTIKFNDGQEPKANDMIKIKYEVES